jgi:hypothetical protein
MIPPEAWNKLQAALEKEAPFAIPFGLTLRDHFAGIALQGMLASGSYSPKQDLSEIAYDQADKMLARRKATLTAQKPN